MRLCVVFRALTFVAALAVVSVTPAAASQKPVTNAASVTKSFVIEAIDPAKRLVTLRDEAGISETIQCGPEVQRFNALKVGDKVTFTYSESIVYAINKAGATVSAGGGVVRTPGDKPGGTISQQLTTTVTVNAIDPKVPSITVTTLDGKKMSFRVENPKNLEGVKAGDSVQITYTQAVAISVK